VPPATVVNIAAYPDLGPVGAVQASLLETFLDGSMPHAVERSLPTSPPIEVLVPDGADLVRTTRDEDDHHWLVEGPGWRAILRRTNLRGASVEVFATSVALANAVADDVIARCPVPAGTGNVSLMIWQRTPRAISRSRTIRCSSWERVRRNYPKAVRGHLERLVSFVPRGDGGRVALLHGEPGTGKTSVIRTLLWEWRAWADAHLVLECAAFVRDPAYMAEVVAAGGEDRWKVIVLEDAAALIDSENPFGGDLSQLLNASDGLVALGTKAVFVLTSNEPIASVHPALVRPGRCVANIEFQRFPKREAIEWLGTSEDVPDGGLALADLFERDAAMPLITNVKTPEPAGLYL
jgi:hypothetical protein